MAKFGLSENERSALRVFASGLTALIGLDAESIGHIADYIGQSVPRTPLSSPTPC